jgi:pimeloyl-ACP methyl ester carboxylesterase
MASRLWEERIAGATGQLTYTVVEPERDPQPGLLLTFGMSRQSALGEHPHSIPAGAFLAAGRRVVSFDLPCHGERIGRHGEGITGMVAAFLAGDDPFTSFVADGAQAIDACLRHGLHAGGAVVVCGISRAGYCALRLAAADRRIAAVAALAPVTDWRQLHEWSATRERPEVAGLAIERCAQPLAGRPVYLAIGNRDERVGTASCLRFATRLWEAAAGNGAGAGSELHIVDSAGHALADEWRLDGARFLLKHSTAALDG